MNIDTYTWDVDDGMIAITIHFDDDSTDEIIFDKASIQRMLEALEERE